MTSKRTSPLTFQEIILTLEAFWGARGCLIWQPHHTEVGAGTMNPATVLRVLGPEPWNVAYVEPSIRPDDGRYGENPNRLQQHYQYQVILKPDPGNPQELYLQSLEALGINPREHDIRFVEDNWESPALGAWGLGWEVWLDGQEITQFTYFQQAGGYALDPLAVELTYGLERIAIALQKVTSFRDIVWTHRPDGTPLTYGEINLQNEREQSAYYFDVADVGRLRDLYAHYSAEAEACLAQNLVLPAHDYVLKMSHTFNVLDARGAIGVTERQAAFGKMRALARRVSEAYLAERERLGLPLGRTAPPAMPEPAPMPATPSAPTPFLLEIGTEELPAADVEAALAQLRDLTPKLLAEARLTHGAVQVFGTPRRLAVHVADLAPAQPLAEVWVKGPPAARAFTPEGTPTPGAEGFARSKGVNVADLVRREADGGEYVFALVKEGGQPAPVVLAALLPKLLAALKFEKTMRWRTGDPTAFSRPIRWLVALLDEAVVPFTYAGLASGRLSRGLRPFGSPTLTIPSAQAYFDTLRQARIEIDPAARRAAILRQARKLAKSVGGVLADEGVLAEVTHLVESPTALLGHFDPEALELPREVLISVMKKHQRYFPVQTKDGALLPHFIAVRNGDSKALDIVAEGNAQVIRARFADARFFVREDLKTPLADFRPRLSTLTFQKQVGSMLDKSERIEHLTAALARALDLTEGETATAIRAAHLCKADLVSQMVVEMTSLQGLMGRDYALRSGETPAVANAIREHYLPASATEPLPASLPGVVVGLADRLDSLTALFAAGLAPTGSADPFGLRRAALGVARLLTEKGLLLDLRAVIGQAIDLLPAAVRPTDEARTSLLTEVINFIAGRLRGQLLEAGFRYDVVDAVLAEQAHNPARAVEDIRHLAALTQRPEWPTLLAAYARCARIVRDHKEDHPIQPEALIESAEKELYFAYQPYAVRQKLVLTVDTFFQMLHTLQPAITRFFDKVLVMADDPTVRANRLALLKGIAHLARGVADLSKLEGF